MPAVNRRTGAIIQGLLVAVLWSSSWVLIKVGLNNLPALTFAGLRYTLAFLFLLPLFLQRTFRQEAAKLTIRQLGILGLLGVVFYTLTQGAQFLGLLYLPANMLSLVLSLSVVTIALFGRLFLGEQLTGFQWAGILISVAGASLYFGSVQAPSMIGLLAAMFALLANTVSAVLSRGVNRAGNVSPLVVTTISMGIGSIVLLAIGLGTEPLAQIDLGGILIIGWLAAVNTALAFTLWNHTLRILSAAESGVINNTMLIWIALLAWIFLGEKLGALQFAGLLVTAVGTIFVHLTPRRVMETQPLSQTN